jgi:hypothetical protein
MPEPVFMKLGMYIMTRAHLNDILHKPLSSVCVSVCVSNPIAARQRLIKHFPATIRIVGAIVFYADRVVSKEK